MSEQHWRLEARLTVREVAADGSYLGSHQNALEVQQNLEMGTGSFMEICGVLAQFEQLARDSRL